MAMQLDASVTSAIPAYCRRWRVRELALFGSALRDDFGPTSDVDVLVDFEDGTFWGIDEWIAMRDELEHFFGRRVDLVSRDSLRNPFRRHEILRTRRVLHAA
jgi:predicted nucleotidyltransferase